MNKPPYHIQPIAALEEGTQFYLYDDEPQTSRLWRLMSHKTASIAIVQPVGTDAIYEVKSKLLAIPACSEED
jgi:hypothetical protein